MPDSQLYFAHRAQIEKDLTAERAAYFEFFLSRRPALRLGYTLANRLRPGIKGLVCLAYSALTSARPARYPAGGILSLYKLRNEKNQIDQLAPVLQKFDCVDWPLSGIGNAPYSLLFFAWRAFKYPRATRRLQRLARRLCRRYPLYVALRGTEAALNYFYFRETFRRRRPRLLISSSDGNPHGRALMAAACADKIPLVFVSHGAVASKPVRAKADLAILYGEEARRELSERGSQIGAVLYYGFKQDLKGFRPIGGAGKILVCLAHAPNLGFLAGVCGKLPNGRPAAPVRVRPHPNGLASPGDLRRAVGADIEISGACSLRDDLEGVDLVIAASSTVHLECLLRGVPTVYLPGLDSGDNPPLDFLCDGLVFQWENIQGELPAERISAFYGRPEFRERLGKYLNLETSRAEFLLDLEERLSQLVE